jgi:hypothetical protein
MFSPIEGAIVTASSDEEDVIVDTTDASGNYSIDITPGPMTVTVEATGYVTDTNQVIVYQGQTTTHNVALTAPVTIIDTSPVVDDVAVGDTALYTIFLYNIGTALLDYDVTLTDPEGGPALLNVNNEPLPVILDVSWISVSSGQAGSVVPGDSAEIVFMVDFRDSTIIPGYVYSANANINNNDPYGTPVILFQIQAIESVGTVAGQVTDANTFSPIEGAIVTASSDEEDVIVDTTDAGGNYSIDITPGPMTVTVEATGYVTDTNQVIVYQGQTTTHDVALTAPMASIDTSPVVDNVAVGDTALYSIFLYNIGTAPLDYDVTLTDPEGGPELLNVNVNLINVNVANSADPKLGNEVSSSTVSKEPLPVILDVSWISVTSGQAGSVVPGDSAELVFMVDFRDTTIIPGYVYSANANINNNDPYGFPVILFSINAVSGGCDYIVGDVNGSDNYNGLDVTYGVNFFKYGSPEPQCDPNCPDVNASCNYNGLDITYGVNYFKYGSPGPQPCADCPPAE